MDRRELRFEEREAFERRVYEERVGRMVGLSMVDGRDRGGSAVAGASRDVGNETTVGRESGIVGGIGSSEGVPVGESGRNRTSVLSVRNPDPPTPSPGSPGIRESVPDPVTSSPGVSEEVEERIVRAAHVSAAAEMRVFSWRLEQAAAARQRIENPARQTDEERAAAQRERKEEYRKTRERMIALKEAEKEGKGKAVSILPKGPTFHGFGMLPIELRLEIWKMAIEPRVMLPRHRSSLYPIKRTWHKIFHRRSKSKAVLPSEVSSHFIPPLLHTCSESRSVALRVYDLFTMPPAPKYDSEDADRPDLIGFDLAPRKFYFDPRHDTFGLPSLKSLTKELEMYRDFYTHPIAVPLSSSVQSILIRDTIEARKWWVSFRSLTALRLMFPNLKIMNVLVAGEKRVRKGERVRELVEVGEEGDEDVRWHTMRWLSWGVLTELNLSLGRGKVEIRFVKAVFEGE